MKPVHNPYAVERPHAVASLLQRQGSLRGGPLNQVSPFKRQLSLRLGIDSLPTTIGSPTEGTSSTVTSTVSGLVNHSLSSASATSYSNGGRERAHSLDYTAKAEQQSAASAVGPKRPGLFGLGSKVTLAPSGMCSESDVPYHLMITSSFSLFSSGPHSGAFSFGGS